MLTAWMKTSNSTAWAKGLWDVQFSKNRALHHGIRRSPYEAMFGEKPPMGLSSSILPDEIMNRLETEEDLEQALNEFAIKSHQAAGCGGDQDESDEDADMGVPPYIPHDNENTHRNTCEMAMLQVNLCQLETCYCFHLSLLF